MQSEFRNLDHCPEWRKLTVLFVHQNFPGQFRHLAPALAKTGHDIKALAIDGPGLPGIEAHRYRPSRGTARDIHPWVAEFVTKVIRGEACAAAALQLKAQGFSPMWSLLTPGGEKAFS